MRPRGWLSALLVLSMVSCAVSGPRPVRAEPCQFELACSSGRLYFLDMLLVCDGAFAWCWSGWNYSSDEGGMDHFLCENMN